MFIKLTSFNKDRPLYLNTETISWFWAREAGEGTLIEVTRPTGGSQLYVQESPEWLYANLPHPGLKEVVARMPYEPNFEELSASLPPV